MKLHISHGADPGDGSEPDWFVVLPLPGRTETYAAGLPVTHEMAVESLLRAGRAVFELDTGTGKASRVSPDPQARRGWGRRKNVSTSGYTGPERRGQS
jgi:hypothetical protein